MRSEVIEFNKTQRQNKVNFRAGDVVKIYRKIKEGSKERIQVFEGMVIAMKGGQSSSPMMTVRKVSSGIGVEIIIPVFSPVIEKIELVKRAKVRRSKLYYIREKAAKALRFKFTDSSDVLLDDGEVAIAEEEKKETEEVVEQEKVQEEAIETEVKAEETERVEETKEDAEKK